MIETDADPVELSGVGLGLTVLAVFVVLLAGVIWAPKWWRIIPALFSLVVFTLFAGWAANKHFDIYPTWHDLLDPAGDAVVATGAEDAINQQITEEAAKNPGKGVLLEVSIPGPKSGIDARNGYVWVPPQYVQKGYENTSFPVIEIFSGAPGQASDNITGLGVQELAEQAIQQGTLPPTILVIPEINESFPDGDSECVNAVGGLQTETYLMDDVWTFMQQHFRVLPQQPNNWGMAGYSTGGFCAVNLALRNPPRISLAAAMDANYHAVDTGEFGEDYWQGNEQVQNENSPDWLIANKPIPPNVKLWLLAGTEDNSLQGTQTFAAAAQAAGIPTTLVLQQGGTHSATYWKAGYPQIYAWMGQYLPKAQPSA